MHDKRNPSIVRGDGETIDSYLGRVSELLSRCEWQSEGHRQWYTHKNPYGCWICEILQIARQLESICVDEREHDRILDEYSAEMPEDLNYDEES